MFMGEAKVDVSIIIVSWNTCDILRDCLQSVFEQTRDIGFEVIVVDNASSDGSVEMVRTEFSEVILLANQENRGFAAANNQAMRRAHGRYVLLLNPDTVVLNGAIQNTTTYAEQNAQAGVFGCRVRWPNGRRQNTCFRFPTLALVAIGSMLFFRMARPFHVPFFHPERYLNLDFNQAHDVDVVAGCFLLIRRKVIDQVGMFDEDFFMYGEEAELCFRVRQAGWHVRYYPGSEIIHLHGASSSQVEEDSKINKRKAIIMFLHKTQGPLRAWLGNVIMALGLLLRIPCWVAIDIKHVITGGTALSAWRNRMHVMAFHCRSIFLPAWK